VWSGANRLQCRCSGLGVGPEGGFYRVATLATGTGESGGLGTRQKGYTGGSKRGRGGSRSSGSTMSALLGTASYLSRRAAQKERVRILYRQVLKDTLNWAVHRHLFYQDASDLRERFEANKHVEDLDTIDRLIDDAEATYNKLKHPDPSMGSWWQQIYQKSRTTEGYRDCLQLWKGRKRVILGASL
ncbi:hypothetical protein Taro_040117, partial [Colocasia esculenta]|nr:hypothetical protein [Colocasia esculenta]